MSATRGGAGPRAIVIARAIGVAALAAGTLAACTSAADRIDAHLRKG